MCGISGIYNFTRKEVDVDCLISMNNSIIHRGPDSGGVKTWKHVGLGHRRLSIIDLSEEANQPMDAENVTIVFNGEVYNFLEIKMNLEEKGVKFITQSDTEVVLAAYMEYGYSCFSMFNGMFALAIYDNEKEELVLARDSFGIKPLYYYKSEKFICFGSEMKVIKQHPDVSLTISDQALSEYMWYGNPLGNNTIYNEVNEITPGSYRVISLTKDTEELFFSLEQIEEIKISEEQAVKRISVLLEESVKRHLISDVPVGVFLSGGIDSSAIVAYASKHYKGKLKTYSVGFDFDKGVNELPLAKEIANMYDTEHHEIKISGDDLVNVIEELVDAHDEPFGDAADIPLYLMTEKLKGEVKVVLQGDGGDEFFGGYSRYNTMKSVDKWAKFAWTSSVLGLFGISNTKVKRLHRFLSAISQKEPSKRNALLLTMESEESAPTEVLSDKYKSRLKGVTPFKKYEEVYNSYAKDINATQAIFYTDTQIILKDTFFEKVDKSTMANSMEVRVPFIDKELTSFMLSVPAELKVKSGEQKYLLKKALDGVVPDKVLYGKKKGFGVPYGYWLQTGLKNYFIEQISTLRVSEFFDVKKVNSMFDLHLQDKGNHGFLLWKVLIFCVWLNKGGLNA